MSSQMYLVQSVERESANFLAIRTNVIYSIVTSSRPSILLDGMELLEVNSD